MTIAPQVRILVLVGVLAALGIGLFSVLALDHRSATPPAVSPPLHVAHRSTTAPVAHARPSPAVPSIDPALPQPLREALRTSPIAVAVLYAPDVPAEAGSVDAARAGAHEAHVGFAALDVRDPRTAEALVYAFPGVGDPAVLIVRRSGAVAVELDGVQDATTVAQAALEERP
jgi:hypothetical protein